MIRAAFLAVVALSVVVVDPAFAARKGGAGARSHGKAFSHQTVGPKRKLVRAGKVRPHKTDFTGRASYKW